MTAGGDPHLGGELTQDPLAAARLVVDTPEQVSIDLPLAGLGSRFTALLVDFAAIVALVLVAAIVAALIGSVDGELGLVLLFVAGFVALWGWFFLFEAFRDGVTPGKRLVGLRVVQDGGEALSRTSAAVRNLLRIVDLQPGVTGLLGGAVMLLHPRGKRLGDLVAGTVVVRDLPAAFPPLPQAGAAVGRPRLSEEAFAALERFAARSGELSPIARARLVREHCAALGLSDGSLDALADYHAEERDRRAAQHVAATGGAAALVRARQARWSAFQARVAALRGRRRKKLSDDQAAEFAAAYRAVAADLARARTLGVGLATRWALERLVARAHGAFHRPVRRDRGRLRHYLAIGLPQAVRERGVAVVAGLVALFGPGVLVHQLVTGDPSLEPLLVPASIIERADRVVADPTLDYRDTIAAVWIGGGALTGMVLVNNLGVAFLTFAAGVFAGLGSLLLLVFNGVMLGGVMACFANRGVAASIWAWIAPHGPFELFAIALAGAAGFVVGSAVWNPGRRTRGEALVERGRDGLRLLGGAALLLVLAAVLEGFAAPARVPPTVKHAIGLACVGLLALYFLGAGRVRAGVTARRAA